MRYEFTPDWEDWIRVNIERGCDRGGMAEILMDHQFDPALVMRTLGLDATDKSSGERDESTAALPIPGAQRISNSGGLQLHLIPCFLSSEECARLIMVARDDLRRSRTSFEEGEYADYRTSRTGFLDRNADPFVADLDRRICQAMGIPADCSEPLQAQWYDVGEEFKYHTDYFEESHDGYREAMYARGQRTWTFMIYLNTTHRGGETEFPEVGASFRPEAGTAVAWRSVTPQGHPILQSLHAGKPVESGFKIVLTKWFRERGRAGNAVERRDEGEYLPAWTDTGFMKAGMPTKLHQSLHDYYQQQLVKAVPEPPEARVESLQRDVSASELVELTPDLKQLTHDTLLPMVESWIGHFLEPTYVYGIRRYLSGASLYLHRDRVGTHVASCVLNIAQQVDEPWPLVIEDHMYRRHPVCLEPGEMLLYESARLLHGRPFALSGSEYANVFVHYRVRDQVVIVQDERGSVVPDPDC